jgi:aminopeptidase YwaD
VTPKRLGKAQDDKPIETDVAIEEEGFNVLADLQAELTTHLNRLCVEIGPRPIGSPGDRAAADYIQGIFRGAGLDVEAQKFDCPAWEHQTTRLTLDGEDLEAAANAFSPPCDVVAPSVAVGTVSELEAADLEGRIGILYGDLTKTPLSPKSWFLKSERDDHVIRLLEGKNPAALITVQSRPGDLERVIADWEFRIPSAAVPARVGLALLRGGAPTLHLRIQSREAPGHTCNVVARQAGQDQTRIVLCAHYDTTIDTAGALDNAAGVAVLLALAQRLSQRELKYGLEWIAFSGHEYLPLGDDEYLRRSRDQLEEILVAINFDAVGQYLGANSIAMFASSQVFQDQVVKITKRYPGVVWVDPWPQSNHSTFSMRGVPAIALSSEGRIRLDHLRADSVEWVSPAKLEEAVSLVIAIVESLQDKPLEWTREFRPDSPKETLR